MFAGERQQGDVSRPLHSHGHPALVPGTQTGLPAWKDATTVISEAAELIHIFPIDLLIRVCAVKADPATRLIPAPAPATPVASS